MRVMLMMTMITLFMTMETPPIPPNMLMYLGRLPRWATVLVSQCGGGVGVFVSKTFSASFVQLCACLNTCVPTVRIGVLLKPFVRALYITVYYCTPINQTVEVGVRVSSSSLKGLPHLTPLRNCWALYNCVYVHLCVCTCIRFVQQCLHLCTPAFTPSQLCPVSSQSHPLYCMLSRNLNAQRLMLVFSYAVYMSSQYGIPLTPLCNITLSIEDTIWPPIQLIHWLKSAGDEEERGRMWWNVPVSIARELSDDGWEVDWASKCFMDPVLYWQMLQASWFVKTITGVMFHKSTMEIMQILFANNKDCDNSLAYIFAGPPNWSIWCNLSDAWDK